MKLTILRQGLPQDVPTDEVREGEIGCLFDAIQNLVEPIDRTWVKRMRRTPIHGSIGWPVSGAGMRKRAGSDRAAAKQERERRGQSRASDSPVPGEKWGPNGPARRRMYGRG